MQLVRLVNDDEKVGGIIYATSVSFRMLSLFMTISPLDRPPVLYAFDQFGST